MGKSKINTLLKNEGIELEKLPSEELIEVFRKWREVFSSNIKKATGEWIYGGTDWHTFSYGYATCLEGDKAREAYKELSKDQGFFLVLDFFPRRSLYKSNGGPLPNIQLLEYWNYGEENYIDIYIVATNAEWTLVLTHEVETGLGPYYATRDWQAKREKIKGIGNFN